MDDWGQYIEVVAEALLGKPSSRTRKELRYGTNGSFKVNLDTGWWDDFEAGDAGKGRGGGVLALIKREKGLDAKEAIAWMRDELKLEVGDNSRPQRPSSSRDSGPPPEPPPAEPDDYRPVERAARPQIVKTYDYLDANGVLAFQVCRTEPKSFLQRRKPRPEDDPSDIKGGWVWNRDGIVQVPYRLPELIEAIGDERTIFVIEGEKDVDNAIDNLGIPATCNAGGAGKWPEELTEYFRGANVVILPDNDPQAVNKKTGELRWHPDGRPVLPGQDHAKLVAGALEGVANSLRILVLPDLPPKGDLSNWIEAGGTSEALYALLDRSMSAAEYQAYLDVTFQQKVFVSKFGAVYWGEPRKARARYEYVIKGLVPRRECVLVYGESQSGKSFFTQDAMLAVARGVDYCGRVVRRGIVVYCAAEAGAGFASLRMPAYRIANGLPENEVLPFVCLTRKFDLFGDEKEVEALIAEIQYWVTFFRARFPGIELEEVVIDTLNKVTPGMDEISGKDVGLVIKRLEKIRDTLNTGVVLVHHKNAAGTGPRGHTSLYAAFETALEIARVPEERVVCSDGRVREARYMITRKQREGEDGERFKFCLKGQEIGLDEDGEVEDSAVVEWIDLNPAQAKKRETQELQGAQLTAQRRLVYRSLLDAIVEYGIETPRSLGLPRSIPRVVDARRWREVYRKKVEDDSDEAVRKALSRASDFLITGGFIGRNNPYVWITGKRVRGESEGAPPSEADASYEDGNDAGNPDATVPEAQDAPSVDPDWENMPMNGAPLQ